MRENNERRRVALLGAAAVLLAAGCRGPSAYQRVFEKPHDHVNAKTFPVAFDTCWTAISRAALALSFAIDRQEKENGLLQASRYFTEGKRTTTIALKVSLQPQGESQTVTYVNAIQTVERTFTRSHTRFFLWLVPLPGGGGTEANRVKESESTIEDKQFYDSFFHAVDQEISALQKGEGR